MIILLLNYFIKGNNVASSRFTTISVAISIHIVLLGSLKLRYSFLHTMHSSCIICSNFIHTFNGNLSSEQLLSIYGQMLIIIVAATMMNQNWILTTSAIAFAFVGESLYLYIKCNLFMGVICP